MKKEITNNLYLITTIIVLLLSIDVVSSYLLSDTHIELCCECPDFSKHSGHSHNHTFEDEVLCGDSLSNQHKPEVFKDFLLSHNLLFTNSYCSKIWQPPKIS